MVPFWGCRRALCHQLHASLSRLIFRDHGQIWCRQPPVTAQSTILCSDAPKHLSYVTTDNSGVLAKAPEEMTTILASTLLDPKAASLEHWYLNRALPYPKGSITQLLQPQTLAPSWGGEGTVLAWRSGWKMHSNPRPPVPPLLADEIDGFD